MSNQEEQRRKLICNFCNAHPDWPKSKVVRHFMDMGISRRTIYSILSSYQMRKTTTRKIGSGNWSSLRDSSVKRNLIRLTEGRVAKSYRELGKKFNCHHQTVKKVLDEAGIKKRSRKVKPKVSETQAAVQKVRLRKLVRNVFQAKNDVLCIMDDETYFTLDGNEWQGKYFYDSPKAQVKEDVKFVEHTKFPGKILLWLAISPLGMSKPVFFESGLAITANRYIENCLPKVKQFISQKHRGRKVVFWPDLASSHYAKKSLEAMESMKIPYVLKDENPPNVPQLRPIEDFWAYLKRKVYSNNFRPKTTKHLQQKIKKELANMKTLSFAASMSKVPANCRKAERIGVNFFLH